VNRAPGQGLVPGGLGRTHDLRWRRHALRHRVLGDRVRGWLPRGLYRRGKLQAIERSLKNKLLDKSFTVLIYFFREWIDKNGAVGRLSICLMILTPTLILSVMV
jgi:hypothetical protein